MSGWEKLSSELREGLPRPDLVGVRKASSGGKRLEVTISWDDHGCLLWKCPRCGRFGAWEDIANGVPERCLFCPQLVHHEVVEYLNDL